MKYPMLKKIFRDHEATNPQHHMTGYLIFSADSFDKPYTKLQRTYVVSSDNKAYRPDMSGYSIFGSCLDGSDQCVRLDWTMAEEQGPKDGWKVEDCALEIAVLSRECDRDINTPRFFISEQQAIETMLLEVVRVGEMLGSSMEEGINEKASDTEKTKVAELLSVVDRPTAEAETEVEGRRIGYSRHEAWVNDAFGGCNWDWKIHMIPIHGLADFNP